MILQRGQSLSGKVLDVRVLCALACAAKLGNVLLVIFQHLGHVSVVELFACELGEFVLGRLMPSTGLRRKRHTFPSCTALQLFVGFAMIVTHELPKLLYFRSRRL